MECFQQATSDGNTYIANGIDAMLFWDGYGANAVPAGVIPPTTAADIAGSGVGVITGTYFAWVRFVDNRGNVSNLSPVSDPAIVTNVGQINYTNVPVPTVGTVVRRQILRNLDGETSVIYVDVDTDDISGTSFSSTRTDANLGAQEEVILADAIVDFGVPPNDKPFIAWHQNRMFAAGAETYREGSCEVAIGTATVQGRGTEWKATFAGRLFYTPEGNQSYEIESVDEATQIMTLTENYSGFTDLFAVYAVKSFPARQNAFQWSGPNLPEAWNPIDALVLPEDGDDVTAMFVFQSYLYFAKRRRLYRLTTRVDPADDGLISVACRRGAVNNRCWVNIDETLYLMDEGGVYAYRGDDQGEPKSTPIQDMFRQDNVPGPKINWQVSRYFHACHSPTEEVVRWYVALGSDYLARSAICYAYKLDKWWVEEYPLRCGASLLGRLGTAGGDVSDSIPQYFVGSSANEIIAPGTVALDGNPVGGTIQGTVSSASTMTLTDVNASFPENAVRAPVTISDGRGRLQWRQIVEVDGDTLYLDRPWSILPDDESKYVVGGIPWEYVTQRMRWAPGETGRSARVEVEFIPTIDSAITAVFFLPDFNPAQKNRYAIDRGIRPDVTAVVKDSSQKVEMKTLSGFQTITNNGMREGMNVSAAGRVVRLGMNGVGGQQQSRFGTIIFMGPVG